MGVGEEREDGQNQHRNGGVKAKNARKVEEMTKANKPATHRALRIPTPSALGKMEGLVRGGNMEAKCDEGKRNALEIFGSTKKKLNWF